MSDMSEEQVIAFVDGRLDGQALAAFEAKLGQDRALVERVAAHRWIARQIVAAYDDPPGDEVDEALVARLGLAGDNVVAMPALHSAPRRSWRALAAAGALAASLAAGVFIGNMAGRPEASLLQVGGSGRLVAGGVLAESLSNRLSGQAGPVRIGVSFRTGQGVCRTFSTDNGLSGLGCREDDHWAVPMAVTGPALHEGTAEYRLAGGDVAPSVMAEVDRRMVGEPLGPAEEKALKEQGWK